MGGLAVATAALAEKAIFTPATTYYLSITKAFNATEASGGSYARKTVTFGTPATTGGVVKQKSTDTQTVTTPTTLAKYPYFCVWTALTGGSRKWAGERTDSTKTMTVVPGAIINFATGAIVAEIVTTL